MANPSQNLNNAAAVVWVLLQQCNTSLMVVFSKLWHISQRHSLCRTLWLGTLAIPGLCGLLNDDGLGQMWLSWVPLESSILDPSGVVFVLLTHGLLGTDWANA